MKQLKLFSVCLVLVLLLGSISVFAYSVSNRQIYFTRYSPSTQWTRILDVHGDYSFSATDRLLNNDNPSFKIHVGNMPNYQYWDRPTQTDRNGSAVPDDHWKDITAYELGETYKTWEYRRTWYGKGIAYGLNLTTVISSSRTDNTYSWCRYWSGQERSSIVYWDSCVAIQKVTGDI